MWNWLKTRQRLKYALSVARELLPAAEMRALEAEVEAAAHKRALLRWAHARDAEWSEMSPEDQIKTHTAFAATDDRLNEYIQTIPNEKAPRK